MTQEHRLIVGAAEVRGIRVRCSSCSASISYGLNRNDSAVVPHACPNCRTTINDPMKVGENAKLIEHAIETLRRLVANPSPTCSLEFEIDDTTAPQPSL